MSAHRRLISIALLLGCAEVAAAAPALHPLFAENAVLQRDRPIRIWGAAAPGEAVAVSLDGARQTVRADRQGRWTVSLPARPAGGPYRLEVAGASGSVATSNVMMGDVWLCSGQSNMEFPVGRSLNGEAEAATANDAQLRLMTIAKRTSVDQQGGFAEVPVWQATTPDSVKDFSAACYFMARDLRASQQVPIGLIDASWGGTPIRAWTDEAGVRSTGGSPDADMVALFRSDPAEAMRRFGASFGRWWRDNSRTPEPWIDGSALDWKPVANLTDWNSWDPSFAEFNGSVWARRGVSLTEAEAAQGATLSLGVLDDQDTTFVNGVLVGSTNSWSDQRHYRLAPGVLKPGENEILVFVRDNYGPGGFHGPADQIKLEFADASRKPLIDGWQYAKVAPEVGAPPVAPWDGPLGVSTIYNGMVASLGAFGLKGVAWYQGEADVGQPGYDRRLAAMMSNWRRQFASPDLPFLIVGLAGFGTPSSKPTDSGWARLVDEQRKAVEADRRSALITAIDLGEWFDIHPANKQDVGKRLALAARSLAYGDGKAATGPRPLSAERSTAGVTVRFSKPLQTLGAAGPAAFELCGAQPGSCRFRPATINGSSIEIAGDGQAVTRVRYAWADFPIVNLYDRDLLPAPPFELPVR